MGERDGCPFQQPVLEGNLRAGECEVLQAPSLIIRDLGPLPHHHSLFQTVLVRILEVDDGWGHLWLPPSAACWPVVRRDL